MKEHEIRDAIERLLALHSGAMYSASQSAQRNAKGDAAFAALAAAARADIDAAARPQEDADGASR